MKLLLVAVFLTVLALIVEAIPAGHYPEHGHYPEPAVHHPEPAVHHHEHHDHHDHHDEVIPHVVHTAKKAAGVVGGVLHHVEPTLGHILSKILHSSAYIAPHVTSGIGAFLRSSSGYHHEQPEHHEHH